MTTKKVRNIRASFMAPQQNSDSVVLFDGWKSFGGSTEQYHVLVLEHSSHHFIEIIIYNEHLNIEAPRIYLNMTNLLACVGQTDDVQEKFNDIRKLLVLQKQKVQILQYINARMTIPAHEIAEEFTCVLVPRNGDDPSLLDGDIQFQKPWELIPFVTNRMMNETYQESGFSQALINWRKECNATNDAHTKSSAYQLVARIAIDGFKHRAQIGSDDNMSSLASGGGKAPVSAAKAHWIHGLRKVQTRIFVKGVKERLSLDQLGAGAPMFRRQQSSASFFPTKEQIETVSESVECDVGDDDSPAPPLSAYDRFYATLSSLQLEMPLTAQSTDHAAYLEELTSSVIGLFQSSLEELHRSQSICEKYSPARQRWIRAFRKVSTRIYTAKLRVRLDQSPKRMLYISPAEALQRRVLERQEAVQSVTVGDEAVIKKVEALLGANWLSAEEDFFTRLNNLNREIASLNVHSQRASYLQGLTAIVVNTFSNHLSRIRKSNSVLSLVSKSKRLWIKAVDKVRAMNCTAKMRHRLLRSPSGRDLLNAKERLREMRLLTASPSSKSGSPIGSPSTRRHTRRDDIELRDLPAGYSGSSSPSSKDCRPRTRTLDGLAGSPPAVSRGIEKAFSADDFVSNSKRGARKSLPGSLQRQGGLSKVAILNSSKDASEEGSTLRSKSARNATLERESSGKLSKSASTNAAADGFTSTGDEDVLSRASPSTLLKRLAEPFVRSRPQSASTVKITSSSDSSGVDKAQARLSINSAVGGTDGERDSFDSRDEGGLQLSLSLCGSLDSGDCCKVPAPSALSPSFLYQRLMINGLSGRSRTHSQGEGDSQDEEGCASPAALRRSTKGRPPSSPMTRQSTRIVPINITADLENDFTQRARTTSWSSSAELSEKIVNTSSGTIQQQQQQTEGFLSTSSDHIDSSGLMSSKGPPQMLQHQQQLAWMKLKSPSSTSSKQNKVTPSSPSNRQNIMPRGFPPLQLNISHRDLHMNTSSCNMNVSPSSSFSPKGIHYSQQSPYAISDLLQSPDVMVISAAQPRPGSSSAGGYFPKPSTPLASTGGSGISEQRRSMPMPSSPCSAKLMNSTSVVRGLPSPATASSSSPQTRPGSAVNSSRRLDTMGCDIARKHNIDPSTVGGFRDREDVGGPRCAQSTIKSQVRGSIVLSDKAATGVSNNNNTNINTSVNINLL